MIQVVKGQWWPSGKQVWHLITGCQLCMGFTPPTSDNAVDLS